MQKKSVPQAHAYSLSQPTLKSRDAMRRETLPRQTSILDILWETVEEKPQGCTIHLNVDRSSTLLKIVWHNCAQSVQQIPNLSPSHYHMPVSWTRHSRVFSHRALRLCATVLPRIWRKFDFIYCGKRGIGEAGPKDSWICIWEHAKMWNKFCLDPLTHVTIDCSASPPSLGRWWRNLYLALSVGISRIRRSLEAVNRARGETVLIWLPGGPLSFY